MSTSITIQEKFTVDGVLTDVTSVILKDPTGTYGVKRGDTDATVVAASVPLVKTATGIYEYTFEEPASGLTYTYWIEYVYQGNTYSDDHTVTGADSADFYSTARWMRKDDMVDWLKQEFKPLSLATPDDTLRQIVDNAVRYWNTHSGYKVTTMVDYTPGTKRVQLNNQFKSVVRVYPATTTTWIWNDHPLWTLVGVTILDNVTGDLIMMSEAFRNYRIYVGTDFRWTYQKSEDPAQGGWLYCINVPSGVQKLAVEGTKRITADETVKVDYILQWVLDYAKALLLYTEGNTLRKAGIIDVKHDGGDLTRESDARVKDLQEQLVRDGRWVAFVRRA